MSHKRLKLFLLALVLLSVTSLYLAITRRLLLHGNELDSLAVVLSSASMSISGLLYYHLIQKTQNK